MMGTSWMRTRTGEFPLESLKLSLTLQLDWGIGRLELWSHDAAVSGRAELIGLECWGRGLGGRMIHFRVERFQSDEARYWYCVLCICDTREL